ncbi:MAG: SRPBCC family protein, partial [Pseudorhodobacter sp.]|nr:SRPBCC family protein [Pseudorhodobacter sp.]
MKLVAKYDLEVPAAFVFAQLVDFDGWERAAMRRGADVV